MDDLMIAHNVAQAIKLLKVGDVVHYYVEAPGIPIRIKTIHIDHVTHDEIHFSYSVFNQEIHAVISILDDLSDFKHVFYN